MSGMITDAVKAVAGPVKTLVVDRIQAYVQLMNSYTENMETLVTQLTLLCDKKLDLEAKLARERANLQVMTRETGNWLKSVMVLIEMQEMKQLMKEDGVAEIVVKMMEHAVLKRLWKDDREIFDIVVDVVKNKCSNQIVGPGAGGVVNAEEDADYRKVAKIASDVIKDVVDEFTMFIKGNDNAGITLVKLLDNVGNNLDIERLMKDEDEMAMILSKAEGIIRKEVGHNHEHHDDDEEELLIPKQQEEENNVQQPVNESFIKEKVKRLRTRMGRLTAFLDDENFKKCLPEGANLGWEVMNALSNSSGSEHAAENSKPHRYCGYCIVQFQVKRRHHDMSERALTMIEAINQAIDRYPSDQVTRPIRDDELEHIPGEFIEGLESREVVLQRILIALKSDQVNIVGVYGMGGCGKDRMTLVESIPRWMCKDTFEKFTTISLMSGHDFSRLSGVKAPILEILLLKGDVSLTTLASDFFGGMKNLKVLSLSNMNFDVGLPESMGELERLQTLHLHHCKLKDVKLIGKLVNLLVLSLRESSFEELALEIGELCNLRLLDIADCKGVKSIPANILSRLSNLEGLHMLNVFDGWVSTNTKVNAEGGYPQVSGSELDTLSHLNALEMEVFEAQQLLTVNNDQFVEQLGKFRISVKNSYKWDMIEISAFRYVLELKDIHANQNKWLRALLKKADCLLILDSNKLTENLVPQLDEDGFKDLKFLDVNNCDVKHIISSSEPDESMAFAKLELLRLQSMHNLEMICDMKSPTRIFSFSNLQRLSLSDCPKLKCGLPLTLELPNLSEISFEDCGNLKFIVTNDASETQKEADIVHWPCLRSLNLESVDKLLSVLGERSELFTREHVPEDHPFFNAEIKYPSLESFKLSENRKVVTLWDKTCYDSNFQNLKFLEISYCVELKYLGSPSMFAALVQLEELTIEECDNLKEVVATETEEQRDGEHVIAFRQLKRLTLKELYSLERFYGGSHKLEFPTLKSLKMSKFDFLARFDQSETWTAFFSNKLKFPCLEQLEVERMDLMEPRLWNWDSSATPGKSESSNILLDPVPNLQYLTLGHVTYIPHFISQRLSWLQITGCDGINTLFSVSPLKENVFWTYSQLSNVESLDVDNCASLEQLFENEDDNDAVLLCGRLTVVALRNLAKLKMVPLHLFKNIRNLMIYELKWKYVFSGDMFIKGREQLPLLENFTIIGSENIEVIIKDEVDRDGEDIVYGFPNLKILKLWGLTITTNFASKPNTGLHFQSLERIELNYCKRIQSFCSGPFTAPKLKQVEIIGCEDLSCFVSGQINDVQGLPSLETVEIESCYKLLSFCSEHLVAPKLYDVNLENCDKMKWFLRGGPNPDDILELPSLERVRVNKCESMESFTSGGLRAPKLSQLEIDEENYSKCANEELQDLLKTLIKRRQSDDNDDYDKDDNNNDDIDDDDNVDNNKNDDQ